MIRVCTKYKRSLSNLVRESNLNTWNRNDCRHKGFTYVDVIVSIAILVLCMLLVVFGINTYYKNMQLLKVNQKLENTVRDELLLLKQTGTYVDKNVDYIKITYESIETEIYEHKVIETVRIKVEDEETGAKREYTAAFQK